MDGAAEPFDAPVAKTGSIDFAGRMEMPAGRRGGISRHFALGVCATILFASSCRTIEPRVIETSVSVEAWTDEGLSGRRLTTDHFEIISTLHDEALEAALPGFLEATYRQYVETVAPADADAKPMTTYIFGHRTEWQRFTRQRFPTRYDLYSRIFSGGFTEGDTSVSFFSSRSATLATLAHEGWHQYLGSRFRTPIPAWLNEGFACYHEAVDFAGSEPRFTPEHNTFRINALRSAIHADRLLPLREIIATDAGRIIAHNPRGAAQAYYAQVWALATFLRHGAGGRYASSLQRLFDDMTAGTFGVQVSAARVTGGGRAKGESFGATAFRAYFHCDPETLEGEYRNHLLRLAGFRSAGTATSE